MTPKLRKQLAEVARTNIKQALYELKVGNKKAALFNIRIADNRLKRLAA